MNRRELLKAAPLALVPFVKLKAKEHELEAIELKPRKFLIFFDPSRIDIEALVREPIPGWEDVDALFLAVHLKPGEVVSDHFALVEQFEEEIKNNH